MLKFWELAPSPNSTKVRMALRFKGIDFEAVPVDMMERDSVIKVSGQELTPVIEDRGIILNDSEAILQYLDANYPDTPRLFPADREGRSACDAWKKTLDEKVVTAWMPVFFHILGFGDDPGEAGVKQYHTAMTWLENEMGEDKHYQSPESPICDLRVAQWVTYGLAGQALMERAPLFRKIKEAYGIPAGRFKKLEEFVAPWNERLA